SPAVRQRPARVRLWIGSVAAVLVAAVLGHQWLLPNPPAVVRSPLPETPEAAPPTPWSKLPAPSPATTSAPRPPLPRSSPAAPVDRQLPQTAREPVAKTVDPRTGALRPTPTLAPVTPVTPDSPVARLEPDSPGTHQPQQSPLALSTAPPQSGPTAALPVLSQALQAGWAVPPQLGESLSYQITLAADGTVITVQPLSSLARDYQTQVGLPQVNQRIPGLGLTQRITVEVNYLLDGSVRVVPQPLAP
ncbi:MAG: hypothetical protein KGQ93_15170, partial [Cyanobacteria bacterium REEB459]|nr:hypothetical protein [Cyanobacteria bacterium REEB459]